jgi:hypothetical protein
MRTTRAALLVLGLILGASTPASALTITQAHTFSATTFDTIGVTPFDPGLGTLDRVLVSIDGFLTVAGVTGRNVLPGPLPVPIGYLYQVVVNQDVFGLGGGYFEFVSPARFLFTDFASGQGEGFAFATSYGYDFTFTQLTDLLGFTLASVSTSAGVLIPPFGIAGTTGDFAGSPSPLDQIVLTQQAAVAPGFVPNQTPTQITAFSTAGTLQIIYDYTPAVLVPGPAGAALMATGLALAGVLAVFRRRR